MPPTRHGNVLSWASDIEPETLAQAERTASLPFLARPLALMPDAHIGMGATIGSVIATEGALVPAAVGVDLGCGMIAVQTSLGADQLPDSLDRLETRIAEVIPAGVGKGHEERAVDVFDLVGHPPITELTEREKNKARSQYGSLGSGNHFVEICLDESDAVYIVTGLSNAASYESCSHGAGRRLSRSKARRTLDVEGFVASMAGKSWQHAHAAELLDEDPRAYKDIDQVMADQQDLVTIEHTLRQILNYKGVEEGRGRRRRR